MSSLILRELRSWNDPPAHFGGWRGFAPVALLDTHVYWENKKRIEIIYQLDEVDDATEEEIEELLGLLGGVLDTIDGYLKIRGTGSSRLKQIVQQRHSIAMAMDAIKRGYAPGKLPSEAERLSLANTRLQQIGLPSSERVSAR